MAAVVQPGLVMEMVEELESLNLTVQFYKPISIREVAI